ncbi:MAG TPA: tRNA lysidine(34) synthetase TilS [Actinomycetales bacterium]|nr:tRNA lysidine(34) synthetase TilS [Actinomycetales bacterium]
MGLPPRQSEGRLDQVIAKGRTAVRRMLEPVLAAHDDPLVLVACSGGPDSLALAATAAFVVPRLSARVGAVIVDHNLQSGSAAAAKSAARQCEELGLDPVTVVQTEVDLSPGSGGLEASARTARYAALRSQLRSHNAQAILLGHTLDDQAEQVLLALARGSGTRSIAGIPAQRPPFYRPFLSLRREETVHICNHLQLEPWLDPTNELPEPQSEGQAAPSLIEIPRRTVVRNVLLPALESHLGPGIARNLARTAALARADDEVLSDLAAELLTDARHPNSPAALDCETLASAPAAIRTRALHRACLEIGVPSSPLAHVHIAALDDLVMNWRGQGPVDLPGGHLGHRQYGTLNLYHPAKKR